MQQHASVRILAVTLVLVSACSSSYVATCPTRTETVNIAAAPVPKLDLLFVVDDGPTMVEEQASIATQLPRLVTILATGDRNGDGVIDFTPVTDIHIGAITADLGVGGVDGVPTCPTDPAGGDDGVLIDAPRLRGAGCASRYPHFLSFTSGGDPLALATDFTCIARTGTGGCTVGQPFEAVLKALLPSSSPVAFHDGRPGHGDDPATNGGFIRDDSQILVVVVTDEDDCSAADPELWRPASPTYTGSPTVRCANYDAALDPVARFVDGLRSLRPSAPYLVHFAAVAGVPEDLVTVRLPGDSIDYGRVFSDPRMQNTIVDDAGVATLLPACSGVGRGVATPAIRLARAAQAFGDQGIIQSICSADWAPILDMSEHDVGPVIPSACLAEPPRVDPSGATLCTVEALINPTREPGGPTTCDPLSLIGTDADGTIHCRIPEVAVDAASRAAGSPPAGDGWYYDDYTAIERLRSCPSTLRRIALTGEPSPGTAVRVTCAVPPLPDGHCE